MKLLRFGESGSERPGILDDKGAIRDISAITPDIDSGFLSSASFGRLISTNPADFPFAPTNARLSAPVAGTSKIICLGLNYADHAQESGLPVPDRPTIFLKATSAICGAYDDLILPRNSSAVDWEVELAIVIGREGTYVASDEAMRCVAGFCVGIDFSERNFSEEGGGQWTKGKSADRFAPLGPWLVTLDEIADPQALGIWLEVNGRRFQNSNTAEMIVGIADAISYASQFMRLLPGDVILTGTPSGVGLGQQPPVYLREGDIVRAGIHGLGEQCHRAVSWQSISGNERQQRRTMA
jgi:2,4-diketo-3-deoxy-L-fuconate hydrolase